MFQKVRNPVVAGQFYDGNNDMLKESIKKCFLDERGPGKLPKIEKSEKQLFGIVVPHAGYIFSGAIAAHSYHFLANTGFADTFIILGPNHTGMGSGVSVVTEGEWITPLGSCKIYETFAKQIFQGIIDKDENE